MPVAKTAKKSTRARETSTQKPTVPPVLQARQRRLRLPPYKPFRLKRIKHPVLLPNVWELTKKTSITLWRYRWFFLRLVLVYSVLSIIFVRGLSGGTDVGSLKRQFSQSLHGHQGQFGVGLSVFTSLLASGSNNTGAAAGVYQVFFGLIISLATIWALRQMAAGERVRVRDAFYKGMYPLIPFILVLMIVLVQTLPFLIGGGLYTIVVGNGIAIYAIEKLLWGLLFLVLAFITIYLLSSSLFALYIVTLPDMTPRKALKSARKLVQYRRLSVFRKLFFLPIVLFVIAAVITIPIILLAAPAAPWVFFVLSMAGLVIVQVYMYTLYRELLE